jgi:Ca-activated chloride channel family protein
MMKRAIAAALSFAFATTILAQTSQSNGIPPAPAKEEKKEPPGQGIRKLSKRQRREKIAGLNVRFQDFLADVEPILLPTETDTFLMLESDAQRDAFVEEFWHRRDVMQGVGNRAFRDMYYARLDIAKSQFRKISSDRAKMFLLHGPPAGVVRTECTSLLVPIEIWKYAQIPGFGYNVRLVFYRQRGSSDYKLWNPIGGNIALNELMMQDSVAAARPADEGLRRQNPDSLSPYNYINRIQLECRDGDEILRAITAMIQSRVDLVKLFEPPQLDKEDPGKILRSLVIVNPNAPKLSTEFSVRYPAKDGSRTDVQMMLLVPRAEITPAEVGGAEVYSVDVVGEVLKEGQLWEKYRYRFDFPGDFKGDKFPIVIDRLLRPNSYLSRVKVVDSNGGAEAIVEQPLDVPEIFTPAEPVVAETEPPKENPATTTTVAAIKEEATSNVPKLRIVPPSDEYVNGMRTIETIATGNGIKAVEFWLDGRKIAVRRSPPFSLDVDFGTVPQMRRIRAVALDGGGKPLTGDDITINTGTDPFRVRIVSPRVSPHLAGQTRVELAVDIPDGDELAQVELYWNQTRVATMFDAPFVQTVDIPPTEGVGYLRAVATLKDSAIAPIEDVVLLNSPAYMEELNVHLVELPTTVTISGKPSHDLPESAFRILDEGKPVSIAKFEYVKNLPLSIGLAIDTSGSMQQRMDEAVKAGAQFFQNVMKKGDKAFLVSFSSEPQVVQKWSAKIADVHAGLAKLRAEEATALYDAVVYSLYNFLGVKGQKALVVITDGKDTASDFTFDQAIEYARRAAVPIYGIAIGVRGNEMDVRYKLGRFSTETGGTTYYIDQARDLERVYNQIQEELRSQYVLGFYPAPDVKTGSKWREVEVKTTEGKVKTIRGYYP